MEVPFPATEATDSTVAPATTYNYWATAVDKAGNESTISTSRVIEVPSCGEEPPLSGGTTLTLVWNENPEPDIAGYVVKLGNSSGSYTTETDVGFRTTYTIEDLSPGETYYFVLSAYSEFGLEGPLSDELSYSVQ